MTIKNTYLRFYRCHFYTEVNNHNWGEEGVTRVALLHQTPPVAKGLHLTMATKINLLHTGDHLCQSNLGKQWDHRFELVWSSMICWSILDVFSCQKTGPRNVAVKSGYAPRKTQNETTNHCQSRSRCGYIHLPFPENNRNRILFLIAAPKDSGLRIVAA